jgi:hypothetical protein
MKNTRLGVEDSVEIAKLCALVCSCKAALVVARSWKTSAAMQGPRGAGDASDGGARDASDGGAGDDSNRGAGDAMLLD